MSNLNQFLKSFGDNTPDKSEIQKKNEENKLTPPKPEEKPIAPLNLKINQPVVKKEVKVEEVKPVFKLKINKDVGGNHVDGGHFEAIPAIEEISKNVVKPVVQLVKDKKDEDYINSLFLLSETPKEFMYKWIELYKKAIDSDKTTMTSIKVRNGKFRFNRQGEFEILPDHEVANKTSNQLLKEIWD